MGLLRKREATGIAMKLMVRKMRRARPAFIARLRQAPPNLMLCRLT
jgi:hypothetical protein